jgi:hypothetical protein
MGLSKDLYIQVSEILEAFTLRSSAGEGKFHLPDAAIEELIYALEPVLLRQCKNCECGGSCS